MSKGATRPIFPPIFREGLPEGGKGAQGPWTCIVRDTRLRRTRAQETMMNSIAYLSQCRSFNTTPKRRALVPEITEYRITFSFLFINPNLIREWLKVLRNAYVKIKIVRCKELNTCHFIFKQTMLHSFSFQVMQYQNTFLCWTCTERKERIKGAASLRNRKLTICPNCVYLKSYL